MHVTPLLADERRLAALTEEVPTAIPYRLDAASFDEVADCLAAARELGGEDLEGVALCVGSTHAFAAGADAYPAALRGLSRLVRPGGRVLLGEGYWKRPPSPEYVAFIGDPVGIYRDHAENVSLAESFGLVPLYATTSTSDEWDDFEWRHRMRVESLAREHPDDPDVAARLARSRAWRDAYLRWGRAEMGFGFYLFQVP